MILKPHGLRGSIASGGLVVWGKRCVVLVLLVQSFFSTTAQALKVAVPGSAHVSGGVRVELLLNVQPSSLPTVYFGAIPATGVEWSLAYSDGEGYEEYNLLCIVPPQDAAGTVDIEVVSTNKEILEFDRTFTYYAAPELTEISPGQHSVLPDDEPVEIRGNGISVLPGVQVYFNDRPATEVAVTSDFTGQWIRCLPPPFPGGPIPTPVVVRVVNHDGTQGEVDGHFEYTRVIPRIKRVESNWLDAWTITEYLVAIYVDRAIAGPIMVFFNGIPGDRVSVSTARSVIYCVPPPQPPGTVDITVVNGDGGIYSKNAAFRYLGTPSTDFHPGDLDQDFRFNLSEVLRVCQFFNSDGLYCDAFSEDGYAVGTGGDQSCAPYPTDNAPQNWRIDLNELLEIIQFYNLHCYQPCPGAPGTYCPPD